VHLFGGVRNSYWLEKVSDPGIVLAARDATITAQQSNQHNQEIGGYECDIDEMFHRLLAEIMA
jgi:hypothetical protein